MSNVIMTLIPGPGLPQDGSILSDTFSSASSQRQAATAMATINVAHQQRPPLGVKRHIVMMGSSLFHHLLCFLKGLHINDLEVCQYFRLTFSISDYPGINGIFNDTVDSGGWNIAALSVRNSLLGKIPAKALCPISLIEIFLKNQFHDLCLVRLHNEITHILVTLRPPAPPT